MKKVIAAALSCLMLVSACGCGGSTAKKEYIKELPEVTGESFPETFDLRDYGKITSVKDQGELGWCWSFASIAAAESSILSDLGTNETDHPLDLSEHHLAWFGKTHIPAEGEEGYDSSFSQSGEGYYTNGTQSSWSEGDSILNALLIFADGVGPALEETAPFQGKNGTAHEDDDWSLDESLRFSSVYDLEAGYVLPSLKAENGTLNEDAVKAVKEMLLAGRAVAIDYAYDNGDSEAQEGSDSPYLNTKTYAHYTYEEAATNHCVTIVGWDDTYSKENFRSDAQPEGDGAWIVRNSWGAKTGNSLFQSGWGVNGSGYFYLSYYDRSVNQEAAFDFDVTKEGGTYAVTEQYDFLPTYGTPKEDTARVEEANVFTAEKDMQLEAVGTLAAMPSSVLTYEVYLLEDGFQDPTDGTLAASFEKEYTYAGYYREKLETPVSLKEGQQYSIVVTQRSKDSTPVYYYIYAENAWGSESLAGLFSGTYYVGVVNKGESYICFENKGWVDLRDYFAGENGENASMVSQDNFCIKAFGN